MSTLIVEVDEIKAVRKHPNADLLDIVTVKGWECVTAKDQFKPGDRCVYFPPDTIMPETLAARFGIAKYLAPMPKGVDGERPPGLRVRASRFRGERSFGTVQPPENPEWPVGHSVVEHYGLSKYNPPEKSQDGDSAPEAPGFHRYTDIENIRNFPGIIADGEEVIITEKIHGSNQRAAIIADEGNGWALVCGSHRHARREFDDRGVRSRYWNSLTEGLKHLLYHVCGGTRNCVVFSELVGPGVQDMAYGLKGMESRVFDISVDGTYLDFDEQYLLLAEFGIPSVPVLYRGPFSQEVLTRYTDGPTTMCEPEQAGKFKGREGVVVRPVKERYDAGLPNFGRVILKSISVDYSERH